MSKEQLHVNTFEAAQQTVKSISDEFILNALGRRLESAPGDKELFTKGYLDKIPPDASDEAFVDSESAIIEHRSQLSDFVASHLKIVYPADLSELSKAALRQSKSHYIAKLSADKEVSSAFIHDWRSGARPQNPHSAWEFSGLEVGLADGSKVDLTDSSVGGVSSNVHVQHELSGRFIHWSSEEYMRYRGKGEEVDLTKRIYLNPRVSESVKVFTQVIDAAERGGLHVKAKIFDRTDAAISDLGRTNKGNVKAQRGDGIVLYAPDKEADTLLSIVEQIYKENYDTAFSGRRASRIPLRIGEGVAIGDEPKEHGSSLTSHRAEILNETLATLDSDFHVSAAEGSMSDEKRQRAVQAFRDAWPAIAMAAGIDPSNIAFNKQ